MFPRDGATVLRLRTPRVFWPRDLRSSLLIVIIIADRQSYTDVDCRQPSFSGLYCLSLEQSTGSHLVCSVPVNFLQSTEDYVLAFFPTFCSACEVLRFIIGHCHRLVTYLLGMQNFICYDDAGSLGSRQFDAWSFYPFSLHRHADIFAHTVHSTHSTPVVTAVC